MNKKMFVGSLAKAFKSRAAVLLLFLLSVLLSSNSYIDKDAANRQASETGRPRSRLFLVTVIDSNDEIIGERCKADQEEITDNFYDLSAWLEIASVFPKNIDGDQFSKAAVNDVIDNWLISMQPTKQDIVVFYYSGHGFRYTGDNSVYPRMWLKTAEDRDVDRNNLRMKEDVYDRIVKLGAGVNIILSDCCNSVPGANTAFDASTLQPRQKKTKPSSEEKENDIRDFEKLFNPDHPVSIIATAADSTELAGGTPDLGGFFTYYFVEAMDKSIYEDELEPDWEAVLNYAKKEAAKKALAGACPVNRHSKSGRCIQTAQFTIKEDTADQ